MSYTGSQGHIDGEQSRIDELIGLCADVYREFCFDECLIETGGDPSRENRIEECQSSAVGVSCLRYMPCHFDDSELPRSAQDETNFTFLRRLDRIGWWNNVRRRWNRTEMFGNQIESHLTVEIADHNGSRIVRVIISVVELFQPRRRDTLDI